MPSAMTFKPHQVWIVTCNDLGVRWDDQNDKGLPPHNANTPGNLEFAPGIKEFAQNTLLGENDQIWQPFPQKGPKYQKRTGTSDVIFNLTGNTHYTDGSSSRPINITI